MTMTEKDSATVVASGRAVLHAKYLGPTNHRGTRITVSRMDPPLTGRDPNRVTVGWDHALNIEDNYCAAVSEYLANVGWAGTFVVGIGNDDAVAVYVPRSGY
jgi:hypothetical protein